MANLPPARPNIFPNHTPQNDNPLNPQRALMTEEKIEEKTVTLEDTSLANEASPPQSSGVSFMVGQLLSCLIHPRRKAAGYSEAQNKPKKVKVAIGAALLFLILVTLPMALFLVQERQEIRKEAATGSFPTPTPSPSPTPVPEKIPEL